MEKLLSRNKLHLHQAYETPFASDPLKDYIGEYGLGVGAQEIIEGNFDPNKSKNMPAANYWLKHHVRRVVPPASVRTNLTLEEFKDTVTKQSKMTTSSSSIRHYSHYKAVLTDNSICIVHTIMMMLPFRIGFTPRRWQKAIDVMLEKDLGDPKINQLRIIVIVEGDINIIMKIILNKHLVPTAESSNFLSP
eukprot:12604010-Ditylum_brightwellii.AAC.1